MLGLADEMWLVRDDDRREPVGFWKGDQTAFTANIAGEFANQAE